MGTDIRLYREKRVDGRWLAADAWESEEFRGELRMRVRPGTRFDERNYILFDLLHAGARAETYPFSFAPRGVPPDLSPELKAALAVETTLDNACSYLYLHELRDFLGFLATATIPVAGYMAAPALVALDATIAAGAPDWRLLATIEPRPKAADFRPCRFDVPAEQVVGAALGRLIAGFDGMAGDNHRIVFYFDT